MLRSYRARFLLVHIGDPSSNQVTTLESQMIHMIQELFGQTLREQHDQPRRLKADSHKVHYAKNRPIRHSLVFKSPLRTAAASFRPLRRFRRPQWPPDRRFYQWPSELGLNGHGNTRDGRLRSNLTAA